LPFNKAVFEEVSITAMSARAQEIDAAEESLAIQLGMMRAIRNQIASRGQVRRAAFKQPR
jgi:hypothetical protein